MDKQIEKTIEYFCVRYYDNGEMILKDYRVLFGEMTAVFYARYCAFCAEDRVKPRKMDYVIRDACKALGITTKRKHYTVFCEKMNTSKGELTNEG